MAPRLSTRGARGCARARPEVAGLHPGAWRPVAAWRERTPHPLSSGICSPPGRIVDRLAAQHRQQDDEEPVDEAPDSAAVAVATATQRLVVLTAEEVALCADAAPVIERIAQPVIAVIAHVHAGPRAALASDGRDDALGPERVIVSLRQELRSLGKHRGGDESPTPGKERRISTSRCSPCPGGAPA